MHLVEDDGAPTDPDELALADVPSCEKAATGRETYATKPEPDPVCGLLEDEILRR